MAHADPYLLPVVAVVLSGLLVGSLTAVLAVLGIYRALCRLANLLKPQTGPDLEGGFWLGPPRGCTGFLLYTALAIAAIGLWWSLWFSPGTFPWVRAAVIGILVILAGLLSLERLDVFADRIELRSPWFGVLDAIAFGEITEVEGGGAKLAASGAQPWMLIALRNGCEKRLRQTLDWDDYFPLLHLMRSKMRTPSAPRTARPALTRTASRG